MVCLVIVCIDVWLNFLYVVFFIIILIRGEKRMLVNDDYYFFFNVYIWKRFWMYFVGGDIGF